MRMKRSWTVQSSRYATAMFLLLAAEQAQAQSRGKDAAPADPGSTYNASIDQARAASDPGQRDGAEDAAIDDGSGTEIVVTGFRASLDSALAKKRDATAAIDSIGAEDLGKFPDSNLAESMQRIPGVALSRGDGGEGRQISVRGLGASFTRVRINGMEGVSQLGGTDINGSNNNPRSFDFNAFPTEIFSNLAVRKTPSADVEEGSLGATVDLTAPKPFDTGKDFVFSATGRATYSEVSKDVGPRLSVLVSKHLGDKVGILGSFAYQRRTLREAGYSAVDVLSANTNGLFCTPLGYAPVYPLNATKGADAANCSTGNPRAGSLAAYNTIVGLRRPDLPDTPGSGAFFPRLPIYITSSQDQERIGGTFTAQFRPDDRTDVSIDLLYSRFDVTREDNSIGGQSFARSLSNNGQPVVSVREVEFDKNGSLVYGVFNGVNVLPLSVLDHFISTFKQVNASLKRDLTDRLRVALYSGLNRSELDQRQRYQVYSNANYTNDFVLDFRKSSSPRIGFGFDVSNPTSSSYGPISSNGTVNGGFSLQNRPIRPVNNGLSEIVDIAWKATDQITLEFGAQYRQNHYRYTSTNYYSADTAIRALPAGTTLADISKQITGVDRIWGHGAPKSWAVIDPEKWEALFGIKNARRCGVECGAADTHVDEDVTSAFAMTKFDFSDVLPFGLRGDAGVRYVHTDFAASGYVSVAAPASAPSPTGLTGQYASAARRYDDWLPSANVVVEPIHDLLLRLSGAKVLARPDIGLLSPTSGVNPATRTGLINNPFLDPVRANTVDVALEWYFRPGSLLSAAFFYKDIKSYVQLVSSVVPFSSLGLPSALLANSNTTPNELFTVTLPVNTPGGPLKGIELNAQVPLSFLPGFLRNFGVLANYTHVKSRINYVLTSANGVPTATTVNDLVNLSPNTASGTLYYEDRRFSIRGTANWRQRFIRQIPASPGSDVQGNASTLYADASASYAVNDHVKLIVEAQNITNETNRFYIDSARRDTLYDAVTGRIISGGVTVKW